MAQRAAKAVACDVGGEPLHPDTPTIRFSLDGQHYATERCGGEQAAMIAALAPFIAAARLVRPGGHYPRTQAGRRRAGAVRAWARERGLPVSDRGRIPASVIEQYGKEH